MESRNKEIGLRLRNERKIRHLTQEQMAEHLEISETFYGQIERGNKAISNKKLIVAYERLGIDPTYILTGDRLLHHGEINGLLDLCPEEKVKDLKDLLFYLKRLVC